MSHNYPGRVFLCSLENTLTANFLALWLISFHPLFRDVPCALEASSLPYAEDSRELLHTGGPPLL